MKESGFDAGMVGGGAPAAGEAQLRGALRCDELELVCQHLRGRVELG